MSDQPASLAEAMAILQTRLPHIGKDSSAIVPGGRQHKYADLAALNHAILPILGGLGLSFTARPTLSGTGGLVLMYALTHVSGDAIEGEYPLPAGSPQQIGSAITYARRYILSSLTGAVADDDDDGAAASEQPATAGRKPRGKTTMTAEQQAEHDQLRDGAAQGRVNGATRTRSPEPDPWQDQPAGHLDVALLAADEPGSADGKQLKDIHTQLTTLGVKDREAQLARIEQIIKGPLRGPHKADDGTERTSKNLSRAEAQDVYRSLAEAIKAKRLAERRQGAPA